MSAAAALGVALVSGGPALLKVAARLPLATLGAVIALDLASWLGEAVVFAALSGRRSPRDLPGIIAVYVGGGFPALVTPFGSGGIPGWTWGLTRLGLGPGEAGAVVAARAVVTSVFFVAAGAIGVAVLPARAAGASDAWWGVAALVLVLAGAAGLASRPRAVGEAAGRVLRMWPFARVLGPERASAAAERVEAEAERFAAGLRSLMRERPGALVVALLGLLVSRACLLAMLPVLMAGLGWRGDVVPVLLTVVAVWAVASASPTPGGSGAVEATMTAALSRMVPIETAGAAALLWRATTFYFELLAGWGFFAWLLARPRGRAAEGKG